MMAEKCTLTAAMVWCDEPIRLHISTPTVMQVLEYMTVRAWCSSSTQVQVLGGQVAL